MKRILIVLTATGSMVFVACNSGTRSSGENDKSKTGQDTVKNVADTATMAEVIHSFNSVDPKLSASLKTVVDHYLQIKNALINNSGSKTADAGKAMDEAIEKIDKSLFTAEQKKVYDGIDDDLKENAEHISRSGGDIAHQREHFSMMSEDMYDLVRAFGGGQPLYHNHCPMANDQKGAMWLSETREVRNPYFGGKMNDCVKVPEVIK